MPGTPPDHLDTIKADAASAVVVVFASRITDVREIVERLERLGVAHRVVKISMTDPGSRERFHVLEEWTGSGTLPQVFYQGRFIGGPKEFFAHPRMQGPAPVVGASLGYAGLVPFVVALAGMVLAEGAASDYFARLFLAYGAVILSFVGAVHWGVALGGGPAPGARMAVSVLPALAAWAALLLPPVAGAWIMLASFLALRAFEASRLGRHGLPEWYLHLRTRLTAGVAVMVAAMALAAG